MVCETYNPAYQFILMLLRLFLPLINSIDSFNRERTTQLGFQIPKKADDCSVGVFRLASQDSNYGESHNSGSFLLTAIPSQMQAYAPALVAAREYKKMVVPIDSKVSAATVNDYVQGDNKAPIMSSTVPYARLNKRQQILSFHFVRSLISKGFISIRHLNSQLDVADVLSKHWSH